VRQAHPTKSLLTRRTQSMIWGLTVGWVAPTRRKSPGQRVTLSKKDEAKTKTPQVQRAPGLSYKIAREGCHLTHNFSGRTNRRAPGKIGNHPAISNSFTLDRSPRGAPSWLRGPHGPRAVSACHHGASSATESDRVVLSLDFGGGNEVGHGEKITNEKSPSRNGWGSCTVATVSTLTRREF